MKSIEKYIGFLINHKIKFLNHFVSRSVFEALDDQAIANDQDPNRLTLAYENLNFIPKTLVERFGPTIKILDISHNKIE